MNHSKNIIPIAAALGALLVAPTTRSEEPQTLPEITVTASPRTDDLQAFFLLTHDFNPDWTVNLRFSTQQFLPEHSGSLWTRYRFLGGLWEGLSLGAGVFAASQRTDFDNTFEVPGYARVDALTAYTWKLGPTWFTAQINVENLS